MNINEKVLPCGHTVSTLFTLTGVRVTVSTKIPNNLGITTIVNPDGSSFADIFVAHESIPALKELIDQFVPKPTFYEKLVNLFLGDSNDETKHA